MEAALDSGAGVADTFETCERLHVLACVSGLGVEGPGALI